MCTCVYMCVCEYVYMCVCVYVSMCSMYVCVYVSMCTFVYVYMCVRVCVSMCTCMYVHLAYDYMYLLLVCGSFYRYCTYYGWLQLLFLIICIRESVDSLCRDGADTPIVRIHWKAFLTCEYSHFKPFLAHEWPIQPLLYPTIPHK